MLKMKAGESRLATTCACDKAKWEMKQKKKREGMQKALGHLPAICNLLMARLVTRRCTASIFSDEVIFN